MSLYQVEFMSKSLDLKGLQFLIERYCSYEIDTKNLLPGSWLLTFSQSGIASAYASQ